MPERDRWYYILAVVNTDRLIVDGPGAIEFLQCQVEAWSEEEAYLVGARQLGFKRKEHQIANDWVLPIP